MKISELLEATQALKRPSRETVRAALTNPKILALPAVKTIPLIGNLLSAYFVVHDLVRKDYVGAGINAVGALPLAGNAYQLTSFAYQVSRSIYVSQFYGADADPMLLEKDLARDPKGTGQRLEYLSELVGMVLEELFEETREAVLNRSADRAKRMADQDRANRASQQRADAVSPEAGQAQAARAAATDRLRRPYTNNDNQ